MPAKLYVVPGSHPCATVMKALEIKGIHYRRVDLVPAVHKAVQKVLFGAGTVPAIRFDDGEKVLGSRTIIDALERRCPEPPLRPADPRARRAVDEAEEWGDEVLQPLVRRVLWWGLSNDTGAQLSFLGDAKLVPPTPQFVAKLSGGAVAWAERRFNASSEPAVKADLAHLPGHLDRIDGWIASGTLGGAEPNAADLQIAPSLRLLLTLDDLRQQIDARPAGELARRLFPEYAGRVPAGVLPATG